ncbi:unnamed protein product [Linum trigynum]|uniref:Uncharacterized protein n=1 Tax=Linum trigynum TaxID=586398 RepID=A0AAV2FT10_9ROSI
MLGTVNRLIPWLSVPVCLAACFDRSSTDDAQDGSLLHLILGSIYGQTEYSSILAAATDASNYLELIARSISIN